jgi:16S rRNA (cytosine1402-N4)-methyltransferase
LAWPALDSGRLLEAYGDVCPRGMTVHDRTRLTG